MCWWHYFVLGFCCSIVRYWLDVADSKLCALSTGVTKISKGTSKQKQTIDISSYCTGIVGGGSIIQRREGDLFKACFLRYFTIWPGLCFIFWVSNDMFINLNTLSFLTFKHVHLFESMWFKSCFGQHIIFHFLGLENDWCRDNIWSALSHPNALNSGLV